MKIIHDRKIALTRCKRIQKNRGYKYIWWKNNQVQFNKIDNIGYYYGFRYDRRKTPFIIDRRGCWHYAQDRISKIAQEWAIFIKLYQKERNLLAASRFDYQFQLDIQSRVFKYED